MAANTRRLVELSMVPELAKEVAAQINGAGGTPYTDAQARTAIATKTQVVALTPLVVTATGGALPAPGSPLTIANTATPTVVELLAFCVDLKAKLDAAVAALKA